MNRDHEGRDQSQSRRRFLEDSLVLGASVPLSAANTSGASEQPRSPSPEPGLLRWRVDRLKVLGIPEDWEAVRLGLHPFTPERVVVLPSGARLGRGVRYEREVCKRIDERIDRGRAEMRCVPAPLPDGKRAAILWIVGRLTAHYNRPDLFEEWAFELADRESLASTGIGRRFGLAHQFQFRGEVGVDCPPIDWWLFLSSDGIDWASPDGEPVHALIAHVGRVPWYAMEGGVVDRALTLACLIAREVDDWRGVADLGRMSACRHLNPIVAHLLEAMGF